MTIEQAIYAPHDPGGNRLLAKSKGFLDAWAAEAERLCAGFGERPAGVACPSALFALPLARKFVAVVQAADQPDGRLAFRLLVLPARLYGEIGGDPFRVADQYPPDWMARGELPSLAWTAGPNPQRLVAQLTQVLNVEPEHTQMLLGGVQILVDGGRLVFARSAPDEKTVRDLWVLLPTHARKTLWPATFAFGNAHRFHVAVLPRDDTPDVASYTKEADAGNYPEGTYELALQTAVESNNQLDLDALLARRSRGQMIWLAVILLAGFIVASFVLQRPETPKDELAPQREAKVNDDKKPHLPHDGLADLEEDDRKGVGARLGKVAGQLGVGAPEDRDEAISAALATVDQKIDEKLGDRKPTRSPGPLMEYTTVKRQLRALAWKHGVEGYGAENLSATELMHRLREKWVKDSVLKEDGP